MGRAARVGAGIVATGLGAATVLAGVGTAHAAGRPERAAGQPGRAAAGCRHVFLSPHQDDEVLSMGAAIRSSVERDGAASVCVALFTTGERSAVRTRFTGRGYIPAGRSTPYVNKQIASSPAVLSRARDREFTAALRRLGVASANIYLDNLPGWRRVPDLNTSERLDEIRDDAARFVDAAIERFGADADYRTMSDADPSADHRALGMALRDRVDDVRSVAFYYPQYQRSLKPRSLKLSPESASNRDLVRRAAEEYGLFNPSAGRYGIGWLSATRAFGQSALRVKVWVNGAWTSTKPFAPGPDTSLLTTLTSYRHS